ncbi:protein adenylyltransferase SelO [Candidatus Thiodiazotropha sp. CDECU1]|uniref:protein adenylyltransferase SelO n=1 Tax=Candidatus Thiodiazotropha sp. CDECU1 TaxID=3065865 RepID=UPI0029311B0B|nr:YdiU family protein [Candidatus Thiodiazotropha sp. CDECU1]
MKLTNSYVRLGENFYESTQPEPVNDPKMFLWNSSLAGELPLLEELNLSEQELAELFSGNKLLPGSEPIALAYAGHQFGHFVPQLGDGRAHIIGEIADHSGERRDIQLKGSGQTSFSRSGDGRYALGPAIREYIMGEAMHVLGIPTTRSLAVTTTGEPVYRETVQPGAVLTRIASSHLRVGTFEYFAARQNHQAIEQLCDFAIKRHYPELQEGGGERFLQLFDKVMEGQIELVVEWLRVGFIHGVMNTDNTAISGETIDYGPCAMMGSYNPKTVFSSIDRDGRYAFGNQPAIVQWNMARFAETLLHLIDKDEKQAIDTLGSRLENFSGQFKQRYLQMMGRKLGLSQIMSSDDALIFGLLDRLEQKQLDYTTGFDRLTQSLSSQSVEQKMLDELGSWYPAWRQRLESQQENSEAIQECMRQANPVVIPRNYHMEQVIQECLESGDASVAEVFLDVLRSPYQSTNKTLQFQVVPEDADVGYQTFCGT